jgi:hypothetical protein
MPPLGKYIYCFIKEKERTTVCGSNISGDIAPVYTIPLKEISAVVSDTGIFEYNPTRKYLLAHQRVMTKIMENNTVVPVAFGTVSTGEDEIRKIISMNYNRLIEQLKFLKDKTELGLMVTWKEDSFSHDIEDEEITALKKKVSGKKEEEVLPDKVRLGQLVEAVTLAKKNEYVDEIFAPLSKLAVMSKLKENIPIKTVFNAYFLIKDSVSDEFDEKVGEIYKRFENKLRFSYTGPWPPYNFTEIRLNFDAE